MAGFVFTALVAWLGCPRASEQDMASLRHGYGVFMGQGARTYRNWLELELLLSYWLPGHPWVGPTSLGLTFKMG